MEMRKKRKAAGLCSYKSYNLICALHFFCIFFHVGKKSIHTFTYLIEKFFISIELQNEIAETNRIEKSPTPHIKSS
jgi:hypothetical protein